MTVPGKKSWVRRHKFATGVAGLAIVGGSIAATGGGDPAEAEASAPAAESTKASGHAPVTVSTNKANSPKDDVELGAVTVDDFSYPQAGLTITNNSAKTSDYMIQVEFLDADGTRVDTGAAIEDAVAPGQSVRTEAGGLEEAPGGTVTARILTVDRFATAGS